MKNYHLSNWLANYAKQLVKSLLTPKKNRETTHILFSFVDHYELNGTEPRLEEWKKHYPEICSRHQDCAGNAPKHTWFYALDLLREEELPELQDWVEKGFGEVELHLHHHFDSAEGLMKKLSDGMPIFQKYGFMRPIEEGKLACFAFIHGNWSLDNSRGDEFCGVDNEVELLMETGCYADFTFPALFSVAQPHMLNSIYYAVENGKPKSYDTGRIAQVGTKEKANEFMIFQGPLTINWLDWRFKWHPAFEDGDINSSNSHSNHKRVDAWVRQGISVKGKENWVFVKVFCHGAQDHKAVLGEATDAMFTYLETQYNDGQKYKLHYVTARESYNIVKAAEDGKDGDPEQYRDYVIPHPLNRTL